MFRLSGRVAYFGPVHYSSGYFVGVIMDDPKNGKNDGKKISAFNFHLDLPFN